ncbi:hypothetical protein GPZ77_10760 [Streptomyces sp. QHH-9511]|nr:hypothetical protein [Streptomyces sp. QHH-9511]QGZ48796.1 hypothetical protein GPZ77_10760 [Streptomyces sp. QHH-9511]
MDTVTKPSPAVTRPSYAIGFTLLSDLALAGCVYAYGRMRTIRPQES